MAKGFIKIYLVKLVSEMNCDFYLSPTNLKNLLSLSLWNLRCSPTWRQVSQDALTQCMHVLCYRGNLTSLVWQILIAQWPTPCSFCLIAEGWNPPGEGEEGGGGQRPHLLPSFKPLHLRSLWLNSKQLPPTTAAKGLAEHSLLVMILVLRLQRTMILFKFFQQTP